MTMPRAEIREVLDSAGLAQWKDDRRLLRALEDVSRRMAATYKPDLYMRACAGISAVGSVVCTAGFLYLVFGR